MSTKLDLAHSVVGLDLSLTSTGIAYADHAYSIRPVHTIGISRIIEIADRITHDLGEYVRSPLIVLEGYAFASKGSYAHELGELGGVVKASFVRGEWPWVHVPPTVRAKFACGRGNASKGEVISAVSARTGIVWSGSGAGDECDAWVLQEMGLAHFGRQRYTWPAAQLDVLKSVDWSRLDSVIEKYE